MKLAHKLVLRVLENELQRLEQKWLKAKQTSKSFINAATDLSSLRKQAHELLNAELSPANIEKLSELEKQESDLCKLIKKDPNKLFMAEILAEKELYEFKQELSHIKMRYERGGL